jgi:multimeric flavodoxin WrbA
MNNEPIRMVLINSSPKISNESVSNFLLTLAKNQMPAGRLQLSEINVRQSFSTKQTAGDFGKMLGADALLFAFPLYFFCLPGMLMRFLQDYQQFLSQQDSKTKATRIFAAVNCGFPEPQINEEAIKVMDSFSHKIGAEFRLGIMLGSGGMIIGAQNAPFMKKTMDKLNEAFKSIGEDVLNRGQLPLENVYISANFPRRLYLWMADRGWKSTARKNGLKKEDLLRMPYKLSLEARST